MAAFGWSVGDLVSAIGIVFEISKALKESGGAKDNYTESITFLESLGSVLQVLHSFCDSSLDQNTLPGVQSQIELIQNPVNTFTQKTKNKFELQLSPLSNHSIRSRVKAIPRQIQWALWAEPETLKLREKIVVPLATLQLQFSKQLISIVSGISSEVTANVEGIMKNSFPALIQQSLTPLESIAERFNNEQRDAIRTTQKMIDILPQALADKIEYTMNENKHNDTLQCQNMDYYCSILVEKMNKLERGLQEEISTLPGRVSGSASPSSHNVQIKSGRSMTCCTSQIMNTSFDQLLLDRSCPISQSAYHPPVSTHPPIRSLNQGSLHEDFNAVSVDTLRQTGTQYPMNSQASSVDVRNSFRKFITSLLRAFRELFIELWPMVTYLLYQMELMQRSIGRLPSLLSNENITFVDVLGRSRRVPYMTYGNWETFTNFIREDFKMIPGGDHILRNRYHIMSEDGEILDKTTWKTNALSDVKISMAVVLNFTVQGSRCPKCKISVSESARSNDKIIYCSNPDCQLEFRFVSPSTVSVESEDPKPLPVPRPSPEFPIGLEVATSLKRVEYSIVREKADEIEFAGKPDAANDPYQNRYIQPRIPEPYKHLLGVKRLENNRYYSGNEVKNLTKELATRKKESTDLENYFKRVHCLKVPPTPCKICSFSDFGYEDDLPRHMLLYHSRIYICIFDFAGCTKSFANEDQWICHITSEHLNWLCDVNRCMNEKLHPVNHYKKSSSNRTRHVQLNQKRAERANAILKASLRERKELPEKFRCPVKDCGHIFEGNDRWECRMTHIGEHVREDAEYVAGYLCGKLSVKHSHDELFIKWALRENIVERHGLAYRLTSLKY